MYLKSLEIHGFKSFAERTVFSFLPPMEGRQSITAIVGPNGSGKSNVSDAIRWVLGEQSMKHLRGKKSTDIIFAGSSGKGQMSVASVSLTIDNTDHRLPVDYDELVIGRRVYRSGESEYVVNGNVVRLIDLQILLAKSQFGHGSYSVVGQGTIDRMLLQSIEERKAFFDEASGIKEFQIKRHQAILKLRRSRDHIDQAELLFQEITPRLKSLSRQVKKLEQRQEVEAELTGVQEQYYGAVLHHHEEELSEVSAQLKEYNSRHADVESALVLVQEELATLAREASRQDVFAGLQKKYQDILEKKHILERDRAVMSGRLQIEYSKVGKQEVGWLEKKIEQIAEEQERFLGEIEQARKKRTELADELSKKQDAVQKKEVLCSELQGKILQFDQRINAAKHQQTYRQFSGLRAVEAILLAGERFGRVYGTVAELGTTQKKYVTALDSAVGGQLTSLVVVDDVVGEACIQYLRAERLGYATFLPLNKIRPRPVPSGMSDILECPGVHGFAKDLLQFDLRFEDLFSYVLGNTIVVEDIKAARVVGIGRVRMVTLEGDVLELSGSMKGGYRKKKFGDVSFADGGVQHQVEEYESIEEELVEFKEDLLVQERDLRNDREDIQKMAAQVSILDNTIDLLERKKRETDSELASLKQERSLQTMSSEDYDNVMRSVGKERDDVDKNIRAVEKERVSLEKDISLFQEEEEKKRQRVFALQSDMQEKQQILNGIVQKRNDAQVSLAKIETKIEDIEQELYQELTISAASLKERMDLTTSINDLKTMQDRIQKLKYKLSLIGGIDEEIVEEYSQTKERHDRLEEQLHDLKKTITDLETLIAEIDDVMKKRRAQAFKTIRKEFQRYFSILFEGGSADLVEVYAEEKEDRPDEDDQDIVASEIRPKRKKGKKMLVGIEITASPPGKKIKHIQSLSGGERTLTSIALVCAILHTNPSPFVVLDEVEAALDEANSLRFTAILKELSARSQFILITHNRATMHAADALYGVTMGAGGMSVLVSVDLERGAA
jgi:chromosome segregation protein